MDTVAPYRSQKGSRLAQKVAYPSFGGVGGPAATDTSVRSVTKHLLHICAQNSCVCFLLRWEIKVWPRAPKCITTNIGNSRCSRSDSRFFLLFYPFFYPSSSTASCGLITPLFPLRSHKPEQNAREPEMTSDEEEVGGDFTVYECPGLAPVSRGLVAASSTRC